MYLERCHLKAEVSHTKDLGFYRVKYEVEGTPLISIIIPNKDHIDDLDRCVEEMHQLIQLQHRKTSYHLDFLSKMREDLYHLDDKGFAKK